jgi:(1->4)-alpha-D-glucan 1-alpha-D-glucosylmutase
MPSAVPHATYRLQLTRDFDFDAAAALAPYLKRLGVTHLYASPFLKARPGSTHGYDIVDHEQLNPELGGDEGFARLSAALAEQDLGLILDFVPNHMGVGQSDNAWWLDVLEWGQGSPYASFFDIDWEGLPHRRHPGVLLPILGKPYGDVLKDCEIELKYDADSGSFAAWYFDHKLPINPQRYGEIIRNVVQAADASQAAAGQALLSLADAMRSPSAPAYRDAPAFKRSLSAIPNAAATIARGLAAYRGETEAGTALLHRLLERQHYRLAYWRVAFSAVNYRRFFDINDLAGLRVEHPGTFRAVHGLVARLIAEGRLQGLRLDHIDGLRDPAQYARRLRRLIRQVRGEADRFAPLYVIVEKILGEGEPLPSWPGIAGTTGYEWLNVISRVLVDGSGLAPLARTWRTVSGERESVAQILDAAKARVIETMLASEFTVLGNAVARIAAGHFSTRDFTLDRLRAALRLYVLEFPVYRTYVTAAGPSEQDRRTIDGAIERARSRWAGPDPQIFDFLRDAVTLDLLQHTGYSAPRIRNFAFKLQQFTGPLMAKSLEDTAFYRDHRLLALNEVGGSLDAGALNLADFHALQQARAEAASQGLTATATHDTKRGEDARARILALSEMPGDWSAAVEEWSALNASLRGDADGRPAPSRAHEYMLYQTLIGAWPEQVDRSFAERVQGYALKAMREGKQETSWVNPNERYEAVVRGYIDALLDPTRSSAFIASFSSFAQRTALIGALTSLSQLALKMLLPGVPDIYQGTELWDLSMVDPDNRRPVDFAARAAALEGPADWAQLAAAWRDGRIKLRLMRALLALRNAYSDLLLTGAYAPLEIIGTHAGRVIAFARQHKGEELVILVGRHFAPLVREEGWSRDWDAHVPLIGRGRYEDALGAARAVSPDLADLFAALPIAVLRRSTK